MSGQFGSREDRAGKEGDLSATIILAALGVAIVLYALLRALGGETLGGLAAGVGGGFVLGCVAARLDEPAGHWSGAALLAGLAVSGAYALTDPATLAPSSYALSLWLAAAPRCSPRRRRAPPARPVAARACAPRRGAG